MVKYFKLLSEEFVESEFYYKDNQVAGSIGSYISITTYFLNIKYKGFLIEATNELGNFNLGKISISLNNNSIPEFKITAIDHFTNLFLRRKKLLKVKCKNKFFLNALNEFTIHSNLEKITKENSFEPNIFSLNERGNYHVKTVYSLQLEDKMGALRALICFYKLVIDDIKK